jgi:hypothetical protein
LGLKDTIPLGLSNQATSQKLRCARINKRLKTGLDLADSSITMNKAMLKNVSQAVKLAVVVVVGDAVGAC